LGAQYGVEAFRFGPDALFDDFIVLGEDVDLVFLFVYVDVNMVHGWFFFSVVLIAMGSCGVAYVIMSSERSVVSFIYVLLMGCFRLFWLFMHSRVCSCLGSVLFLFFLSSLWAVFFFRSLL